jgi:phosphatidate cytidylyltransferase
MTGSATPLVTVLGSVWAVQAVASVVIEALPGRSAESRRKVRAAVHGWWPVTLLTGGAVLGGPIGTTILFAVASTVLVTEGLRLVAVSDRPPTVSASMYALVGVEAVLAALGLRDAMAVVAVCAALGALPLVRLRASGVWDHAGASGRLAWLAFTAVYAPLQVPALYATVDADLATGVVAFLLLAVMTSDAGQFVVGKLVGRTKLAPTVSPGKTLEGLAGGLAVAATVGAVSAGLVGVGPGVGAAAATGLAALGVVGDLTVSAVKRDRGVKDAGTLVPGQGGLFDRLDSLIFAAPVWAAWWG